MKNAYGVEPTQFKKKKNSKYAIQCRSNYGPLFGNYDGYDICINDHCNRTESCYIINDGIRGYECHPEYKCSLFVNTAGPDSINYFSVLDYEVYTHDQPFCQTM